MERELRSGKIINTTSKKMSSIGEKSSSDGRPDDKDENNPQGHSLSDSFESQQFSTIMDALSSEFEELDVKSLVRQDLL